MARKIIWSFKALEDRKEILQYWKNRNKSTSYSKKLNDLFKQAIAFLSNHPLIGRPSEIYNVRIKIVRDYLIVYEVTDKTIVILAIWDGRRNPDKFNENVPKL
jgi:addiction module RelE/StbE family toxin